MTIRTYPQALAPFSFKTFADVSVWARSIHESFRQARHGKLECVTTLTLTINSATTVFNDKRLSPQSGVTLDPMTLNASAEKAAGTLYCLTANRGNEQWTFTNANNAQGNRVYAVSIIG